MHRAHRQAQDLRRLPQPLTGHRCHIEGPAFGPVSLWGPAGSDKDEASSCLPSGTGRYGAEQPEYLHKGGSPMRLCSPPMSLSCSLPPTVRPTPRPKPCVLPPTTTPAGILWRPPGLTANRAGRHHQRVACRLAGRGFVALVFDAACTGGSGGESVYAEAPFARMEDIHAGVDYLVTLPYVDEKRTGAIGICACGCTSAPRPASTSPTSAPPTATAGPAPLWNSGTPGPITCRAAHCRGPRRRPPVPSLHARQPGGRRCRPEQPGPARPQQTGGARTTFPTTCMEIREDYSTPRGSHPR